MGRESFRHGLVALGILGLVAVSSACAGETETRTFSVTVNGKQAGQYQLVIQSQDDGLQTMSAETTVQAPQTTGWYLYGYRGKETWKSGRLQKLEAASSDAGKKRVVQATATPQHLRVLVNGQRSDAPSEVWTTSFWHLPVESQRDAALPMLDVNSGKVIQGRLEKVAVEKLNVVGDTLECSHYRVKGEGMQADIWYDGADRMVRLEATSEGRKQVLELSKVTR
ncbi:MAG TPA: DUF6134 family protein [Gemmataceae bacterium]|nr:DUF6134 family protein [Gemmataceae bacterium]